MNEIAVQVAAQVMLLLNLQTGGIQSVPMPSISVCAEAREVFGGVCFHTLYGIIDDMPDKPNVAVKFSENGPTVMVYPFEARYYVEQGLAHRVDVPSE